MLLVVAIGLWAITRQGMLLLISIGLTYRLFTKDQAEQGDDTGSDAVRRSVGRIDGCGCVGGAAACDALKPGDHTLIVNEALAFVKCHTVAG